jgi:predicted RND superfamily exporter protein
MINKLIRLAINKPNRVIFFFALTLLISIASLPFLSQVSDISQLISKKDSVIKLNTKMEKIFGSTRLGLLTFQDALTLQNIKEAKLIHERLLSSKLVTDVISVFSEPYLQSSNGNFDVESLIKKLPKESEDISKLITKLESFPLYKHSLYQDSDLNYLIQFEHDITDQEMSFFLSAVKKNSKNSTNLVISGWPEINNSIKGIMDRDLYILIPLIFLIITIIFFILFRSIRGIIIPLITISIAITSAVGFMSIFGFSLNVVSNSIPILLVAIGTSDGIHFMTKYYLYKKEGLSHTELIAKAGNIIAPTILLTSLTTMGGFLANIFSPVGSIQEFGIITAVGVLMAGLASFLLIPALLAKFTPEEKNEEKKSESLYFIRIADFLYNFLEKNKIKSTLIITVLFTYSVYSIFGIQANYTMLGYFSPTSSVVTNAIKVSKSMGGLIEFNITIDTNKSEGLLNTRVLEAFDEVINETKAKYPRDVIYMTALSDYIKNMSRAYNGAENFYKVPESDNAISQYLEVYSWSGEPEDDLKYVTNEDYSIGRIYGRFKLQLDNNGELKERNLRFYENIVNEIKGKLAKKLPNSQIENYGELPMWITTLYSIVDGQITSVLLAILIVFLISFPILREISLTCLALVPILFAICSNFAFMNIFDIQLDIATSLVSAMAIGIGIDDALHFLLTYKRLRLSFTTVEQTLKETMRVTGKAIFATSATLTIGYSVFFFSSFTPINHFGLLNILTIIIATLATFIVMPLIILITKPLKEI